jgi:hypothetical protein
MKLIFLLLPCLLYSSWLYAQSSAFKVGTPYKVVDAQKKYYISDPANNLLLSIKERNNKIVLQRFDLATLKEVKRSNKIILPTLSYVYDIVRIHGRIYLIQVDYSNSRQNLSVFAQQIDPFNCTLFGERVLILEGNSIGSITL